MGRLNGHFIHADLERGSTFFFFHAREFQTKMDSYAKMNDYAKLVNFYMGLEKVTKQNYFKRAIVPKSLEKAFSLAKLLIQNPSNGGRSNWNNGNHKDSHQSHKKKNYNDLPKRKREDEDEAKHKDDGKKAKNLHYDNNTYYFCKGKGHLIKNCSNKPQSKKAKVEDKFKRKKLLTSITEVVSTTNENANSKEVMSIVAKDSLVESGRTIKTKTKSLKLKGHFKAELNVMAHQKGLNI